MVLVSNIIAIYLQVLCVKLGTVTGLNLAENIKEHCPRYLNYALYFFAEAAIISTDIAEVSSSSDAYPSQSTSLKPYRLSVPLLL